MVLLGQIILLLAQAYIWIVILSVLLSYFMDPFHPVRQGVDNLVRPLLDPLRKVIPPLGMIDISPIVLVILVNLVSRAVAGLLFSI